MIQRISPTAILLSALQIRKATYLVQKAQCQKNLQTLSYILSYSISFELAQIWLYSCQIRHLCQGTQVGYSKVRSA